MTAHRAKGLEFDHVVILNGGWERPSRGEDVDAPRRLFYVAMTRAKQSLTVMTSGAHCFLPDVVALRRSAAPDPALLPTCLLTYRPPDPREVDLSFPGRLVAGNETLQAITEAQPGDPVTLAAHAKGWVILDARGRVLSRMSRAFRPPDGARFLRGEVSAVVRWRKVDGDEAYHHSLRREEWEVVLPELVFEA